MNAVDRLIKIEKTARQFGFEWPNVQMIIDQAISECEEIRQAVQMQESAARLQEEIGDLLHTALSLCLFMGFDLESTLQGAAVKFENRFASLQAIAKARGYHSLKGEPIELLLALWQEVKANKIK